MKLIKKTYLGSQSRKLSPERAEDIGISGDSISARIEFNIPLGYEDCKKYIEWDIINPDTGAKLLYPLSDSHFDIPEEITNNAVGKTIQYCLVFKKAVEHDPEGNPTKWFIEKSHPTSAKIFGPSSFTPMEISPRASDLLSTIIYKGLVRVKFDGKRTLALYHADGTSDSVELREGRVWTVPLKDDLATLDQAIAGEIAKTTSDDKIYLLTSDDYGDIDNWMLISDTTVSFDEILGFPTDNSPLKQELDSLGARIDNEAIRRSQEDQDIRTSIQEEVSARESGDSDLGNRITQENTERTSQFTQLSGDIAQTNTALDTERTAREDADDTLQQNIDTKVDKRSLGNEAYVHSGATQTGIPYSDSATPSSFVIRKATGDITLPSEPTAPTDATSKDYVDGQFSNRAPLIHAGRHRTGGADPLSILQSQVEGLPGALASKGSLDDTLRAIHTVAHQSRSENTYDLRCMKNDNTYSDISLLSATNDLMGMMPASAVRALNDARNRISALESTTSFYPVQDNSLTGNMTSEQVQAKFQQLYPTQTLPDRATLENANRSFAYIWSSILSQWIQSDSSRIALVTNDYPGVVKGGDRLGVCSANADGTLSLVGWDNIPLESTIALSTAGSGTAHLKLTKKSKLTGAESIVWIAIRNATGSDSGVMSPIDKRKIDNVPADTHASLSGKVDKLTSGNEVYAHSGVTQEGIPYTESVSSSAMVRRKNNAQISLPITPLVESDAASKGYVDSELAKKVDAGATLAPNRMLRSDADGKAIASGLDESNIMTIDGSQTISGMKVFTGPLLGIRRDTAQVIINVKRDDLSVKNVPGKPWGRLGRLQFLGAEGKATGIIECNTSDTFSEIRLLAYNIAADMAHTEAAFAFRRYIDGRGLLLLPSPPDNAVSEEATTAQWVVNKLAAKQNVILRFTNVNPTWSTTGAIPGYPYRGSIPASGVTAAMDADVRFDSADASSGNYAPICETGTGVVYIWSKTNVPITIPRIVVIP